MSQIYSQLSQLKRTNIILISGFMLYLFHLLNKHKASTQDKKHIHMQKNLFKNLKSSYMKRRTHDENDVQFNSV